MVVVPSEPTEAQRASLSSVLRTLHDHGASVTTITTVRSHGVGGLEFELLKREQVEALYNLAHRALLLVVTLGTAQVNLRVDERPTNASTIPLSEYLSHKAITIHVSRAHEVSRVVEALRRERLGLECDGYRDPRCIPFFIFERTEDCDLSSASGRSAFSMHYSGRRPGHGSALVDGRGREWASEEFHSADLIHVGGATLPVGFHWNVLAPRRTELANGWEVWQVGAAGYANVHPDAHIRQGNLATRIAGKRTRGATKTPRAARRRK